MMLLNSCVRYDLEDLSRRSPLPSPPTSKVERIRNDHSCNSFNAQLWQVRASRPWALKDAETSDGAAVIGLRLASAANILKTPRASLVGRNPSTVLIGLLLCMRASMVGRNEVRQSCHVLPYIKWFFSYFCSLIKFLLYQSAQTS
jgi:hypothetical protein